MATIAKTMKSALGRIGLVRFRRNDSGATAVEFGLVALPFIALMFAILETALTFFAGQTMETAVGNAARLIRTGQAQQAGFDLGKFKDQICNQLDPLFSCAGIKLDVRKAPTFDQIDLGLPLDPNTGDLDVKENYDPGHGGDIVIVRAYYEWPVVVRLLGNDLSTLPDGKHLLVATAAFRNEPFPW